MSKASKDLADSAETIRLGPNYFGYYTSEVADLILQEDEFLPFFDQKVDENIDDYTNKHDGKRAINLSNASSMFSNCMGAALSDFRQERLKALLHQSVTAFKQEVDEMEDIVFNNQLLQSYIRSKKHSAVHSCMTSDVDADQFPCKRRKMSSASSLGSSPLPADHLSHESTGKICMDSGCGDMSSKISKACSSENQLPTVTNSCAHCKSPEGPTFSCNTCGIRFKQGSEPPAKLQEGESPLNTSHHAEWEVDEDLRVLLETNGPQVEAAVKKCSDELSTELGRMEQQLDKLIEIVLFKCRPMTPTEKQQLRFLIQRLPPRNLDRVVEIIQRSNPPETDCCDEIHVDLENQDNHTLWRLYYCQKLSMSSAT